MAGHEKVVARLLKEGASTIAASVQGLTAYDMALRDANEKMSKILEEAMIAQGHLGKDGTRSSSPGGTGDNRAPGVRGQRRASFSRQIHEQAAATSPKGKRSAPKVQFNVVQGKSAPKANRASVLNQGGSS